MSTPPVTYELPDSVLLLFAVVLAAIGVGVITSQLLLPIAIVGVAGYVFYLFYRLVFAVETRGAVAGPSRTRPFGSRFLTVRRPAGDLTALLCYVNT
ncbi:hypothetical protein [Halovivax gelatinilyticus]|uniref:hypothetical protein n=1 Tax=Halovivax gelatinilyticus TaxID=2961597 RepID=UPI0020CA6948|nr:hypothetical protein [Halovivax gelatinilyticus]